MMDARHAMRHASAGLTPEMLRARAQCRRETAARLWDDRLERLLLEEAEELERLAVALELEAAMGMEANAAEQALQPAALRDEATQR